MENLVFISQIATALIVIFLILMQVKGGGISRSWSSRSSSFTRRGLEKLIFKATFAFSFIFILISVLQLFI